MVVFNPIWGKDRRILMESASHPLQGVERVNNPEGKPFVIVHGYDRDWDVKALFEFKYRLGAGFDLNKFKAQNEEMAKNLPVERRGLRRARYEVPAGSGQLSQSGRIFKRHL
jgi:hypothetical protein